MKLKRHVFDWSKLRRKARAVFTAPDMMMLSMTVLQLKMDEYESDARMLRTDNAISLTGKVTAADINVLKEWREEKQALELWLDFGVDGDFLTTECFLMGFSESSDRTVTVHIYHGELFFR